MKNVKSMVTLVLLVSLLLLLGSDATARQDENNLVRNPSFENIRDDSPVYWRTSHWAGRAEYSIDRSVGRTGPSVKIQSSDGADVAWTQSIAIPPENSFGRYRLSGWIKTENVSTTTGRGVQMNVHGNEMERTQALTGTNDWTKVECEFEVAGQSSVDINMLFGGWGLATGTAWFDDIKVEFIEDQRPQSQTLARTISIDPDQQNEPMSEYIYGQFIEHMGRCIYGGIWAEMLEDRKFFYPVPAQRQIWGYTGSGARVLRASPWQITGEAQVEMSTDEPLSGDHEPRITVSGQPGGIYQDELGVLAGKDYTGRIWLRGDRSAGPIHVSLVWGPDQQDRETVTIRRPGRAREYSLEYTAGADTDNARLEIVAEGNGSFYVGTVSLMPGDNVQGFRRDTLELLKELDAPIYRWPGGNFVSGYDWRDGIGDRDRRPTRSNPAWTGIETNDMGMHEFIELCRILDAEPLITVNTGFGDAYSAAAQVEYANGDRNTHMGRLRADNGSRQPFNVKYWCVGNEMWGEWQLGYMALEHYVLKNNWVESMMREVSPDIVTIASGDSRYTDFSEGLLTHSADYMDHCAEHFYCQSRSDLTEHVRQVPQAILDAADNHREFRRDIPGVEEKDIRIAMTEWNYWYGPHVYGELGTRYFMRDALGIAAGLHEYHRNSELFHSAFYAQTVNVIGAIKTTKTSAQFDATGFPLVLYRREFGSLPLTVSGWDEKLDVAAALTEDKNYLTVGFVNASWDSYEVDLELNGLTPADLAAGWVIANDNPMAFNDPAQEPVIGIEELPAVDAASTITIEPVSITLFRIPLN